LAIKTGSRIERQQGTTHFLAREARDGGRRSRESLSENPIGDVRDACAICSTTRR